ncbi:hypothetical protein ACOCEA_17530 [Maribacter sp. CXY002]|uniref:hypothetical protein n=1 Tax=Maribacter luteocoastalis TaxID=3407671 RepID=UPI003B682988
MKKIAIILGCLIISACTSTQFVGSWKSPEISKLQPEKLLVVGMTDNLTARKIFERELSTELIKRGINAHESATIIDASFTDSKKSETEIDEMKDKLISEGFDTVILTAVIGVNEKRVYHPGQYYPIGFTWYRFGRYYYWFQDVYYTPDYYNDYRVYQIETSIYNIKQDGDKSLLWVGSFNIVDPSNVSVTVNDYVTQTIKQLEKEGVIDTFH